MNFAAQIPCNGYVIVIEKLDITEEGDWEVVGEDSNEWIVNRVEIKQFTPPKNYKTIKELKPKEKFPTRDKAIENAINLAKEEIKNGFIEKERPPPHN